MSRVTLARRLRREATHAETKLWLCLRNRQMAGLKFRRQQPIEGFIADFACVEARLVIELDGGQHVSTADADRLRTEALSSAGYLVLRFWNDEVLQNIDGVLAVISDAIANRPQGA